MQKYYLSILLLAAMSIQTLSLSAQNLLQRADSILAANWLSRALAQVVRRARTSCPEPPHYLCGGSGQTVSKLSTDFETGSIMLWCNSVSDYKFTKKSAKHQISRSFLTVFCSFFSLFHRLFCHFPLLSVICHPICHHLTI